MTYFPSQRPAKVLHLITDSIKRDKNKSQILATISQLGPCYMFVIWKTTWCFLGEGHQAKLSLAHGIRKTQGASCDGEGRE